MTVMGRLVAGVWLAVSTFALAPVATVAAQTTPPAVTFVIDSSGSVRPATLAQAVAAAAGVLDGLSAQSPAGVIAVSTTARVASPLGTDRAATKSALAGLVARGDTALNDGLMLAAELLLSHPGPRLVVALSDGDDTTSAAAIDQAVAALDGAGVEVAGVLLVSGDSADTDLQTVVDRTGGRMVPSVDAASIGTALDGLVPATPTTVALSPAPPDGTVAAPPTEVASATTRLVVGASAFFVALLLCGYLLFEPRARFGTLRRRRDHKAAFADLGAMAAELADRAIRRGSKAPAIDRALESAGIQLRAGEFVAAVAGLGVALGLTGMMVAGPALGLLLLVASPVLARAYLRLKTTKRREAFAEQLSDTLQLLAGGLRAGYGIMQAVDAVARESESPTSEEFGRLVIEHRLGRGLEECLWAMSERVDHQDFTWVVQALAIHREVGGDLVQVLETVAETIRERGRLRRQVRSLSAEGRISAQILFALPILLAGFIRITNPSYFGLMLGTSLGRLLLTAGAFLLMCGGLWMKRLVRPVF